MCLGQVLRTQCHTDTVHPGAGVTMEVGSLSRPPNPWEEAARRKAGNAVGAAREGRRFCACAKARARERKPGAVAGAPAVTELTLRGEGQLGSEMKLSRHGGPQGPAPANRAHAVCSGEAERGCPRKK